METEAESAPNVTIKQSLENLRRNAFILVLLLLLISCNFVVKSKHNEMVWSVAVILVMKAESRPQPMLVLLLASAVTGTTIFAIFAFGGLKDFAEGLTLLLLLALVASKWIIGTKAT